jgi:predicted nucleic acid-binding protein
MEKRDQTSDEKAPSFTPRTPLAKRLWELRQEVLASGVPLLNRDEIRQELQARRGGVLDKEKAWPGHFSMPACSSPRSEARRGSPTALWNCWTTQSVYLYPVISSDFVQLEVLPKAVYFRHTAEASFYRAYFASVTEMVPVSQALVAQASEQAQQAGLAAMDALHVAAARAGEATEFMTVEHPRKSLFRMEGLTVRTLLDQ